MEKKRFYVYIYLDPRKPGEFVYKTEYGILRLNYEPIYVGKGQGNRKRVHLNFNKCRNTRLKGKMKLIRKKCKRDPYIKVLKNLSEKKAFKIEEEFIEIIGRLDWGIGPLCNNNAGGPGLKRPDLKSKQKKSLALKKKWKDPEFRKKMSKVLSKAKKKMWSDSEIRKKLEQSRKRVGKDPEFREKMRKINKERWKDPEYRKKMNKIFKKIGKDPEFREKMRKINKERWKDSEYKNKMSQILKETVRRGEDHHNSKLNKDSVLKIRKFYEDRKYYQYELAEKFNVSQSVICGIVHRTCWAHVN